MERDYLTIGATPAGEECEQLGPDYDPRKAREECRRFMAAIRFTVGKEPDGAWLSIKGFLHEFGTYHEVVCNYETQEGLEYALKCERMAPETWPTGLERPMTPAEIKEWEATA